MLKQLDDGLTDVPVKVKKSIKPKDPEGHWIEDIHLK